MKGFSRTRVRALAVGAVAFVFLAPFTSCASDKRPIAAITTAPGTAALGDGGAPVFSTGKNDVVLKIESGIGGFRTFQSTFAALPTLLITGDGRVFSEGPVPTIFPGPFLPNIQVATVTRAEMAELLNAAKSVCLLGKIPDYTVGVPQVTDVGSTALTLTVNGQNFTHEAFALGMEQVDAPDRKVLKDFIELVTARTSGLQSAPFLANTYLLATLPVEISTDPTVAPGSGDPVPQIEPWSSEIGINLKDLTCAPVSAEKVQALFEGSNQLTYFSQDGGLYTLAVRPVLPGQPGCESTR